MNVSRASGLLPDAILRCRGLAGNASPLARGVEAGLPCHQ
jgi:hypothetical protein